MPEHPEIPPWMIGIKDYVDQRFVDHDRAVDAAVRAMDQRMDELNNFRRTLSDQAAGFLPRAEYVSQHSDIMRRVERLETEQAGQIGGNTFISSRLLPILAIGVSLCVGVAGTVVFLLR